MHRVVVQHDVPDAQVLRGAALRVDADAGAQDATAALLSSSADSFRFSDDTPKSPYLKAASALPQE